MLGPRALVDSSKDRLNRGKYPMDFKPGCGETAYGLRAWAARAKGEGRRLRLDLKDVPVECFAAAIMQPEDKQITVLVVEDSPDDSTLLQIAARKICPEICFCFVEGPFEALAYLEKSLPDLVLVDVGLRVMDGFALVERIRELPRLVGLKVLMWSGGLEASLRPRALDAGADLLLQKGASYEDLFAEVKRICDIAKAA